MRRELIIYRIFIDNNGQVSKIYICIKRRKNMYQIVTDSCCDLPYDILEKEKIKTISMKVIINEDVFLDDGGKTFDMEKFYNELKQEALPSTSQVNVTRFIVLFTPYSKENIPVLYLWFSSGLSCYYQSALLGVETIKENFPECKIYIFDTLAASGGQALMLLDAIHNQNDGFSLEDN